MAGKAKTLAAGPTAPTGAPSQFPPVPDVFGWLKRRLQEWLEVEPEEPVKTREELKTKIDELYQEYWEERRRRKEELKRKGAPWWQIEDLPSYKI